MKILVGPKKSGKMGHGYCYVKPGEIVIPGSLGGYVGLNTRKATTWAVVGETDLTVEQIAEKDMRGFFGGLPLTKKDRRDILPDLVQETRREVARYAKMKLGTVVKLPGCQCGCEQRGKRR